MAEPKCSIEGCEKPHRYKASGWCGMHYARARKYGTPDAKVREYTAQTGTCRAEGCDRPAQRKECCQAHCVRLFRGEKDALATPISTQTKKTCTLDGCSRTHVARGYCDQSPAHPGTEHSLAAVVLRGNQVVLNQRVNDATDLCSKPQSFANHPASRERIAVGSRPEKGGVPCFINVGSFLLL